MAVRGSTGGKDVHAAHHQLQIQAPPIFLMELGGAWSSRNEENLLHFVSASQEKPRAWIWVSVGECVVKQMPQDWELGSALHLAQL